MGSLLKAVKGESGATLLTKKSGVDGTSFVAMLK